MQIKIEDTGIGVPNDKFETIFEHFSRLTPSYQGTYKGSGLGLYTVKRYINAMKGEITVESEVSKGSCFTVTLPLIVDDHADRERDTIRMPEQRIEPSISQPTSTTTTSTSSSVETIEASKSIKTHVLLVEDQPIAAEVTCMLLSHLACSIEVAPDGKTAVEKAKTKQYDLIFMDIGLPDTTGIEVTKKIRALSDPKKSQVPIVALTGHAGDDQYRQDCFDAGMNDVLPKPSKQLALQSTLQQWVWDKLPEKKATEKTQEKTIKKDEKEEVATLPLINWEESLVRCGNNRDIIDSLLPQMPANLQESKAILAKAYAAKDTNALREELHRILGAVVFFSLPRVETAIRNFQAAAKAEPQDKKQMEIIYHELRSAFDAFCEAYEKGELNS